MRVLTIIPTYNEKESLPLIVKELRESNPAVDLLVVDDNSPDGTGELAESFAAEDSRIKVLHRKEKQGLGKAYLAGFHWGLDAGYDVFVEMDADGSHDPRQLPLLLEQIEKGADLVLGSRYIRGGEIVNWPKRREFLSKGANLYTRLLLGVNIKDITGGYRAFTRQALESLDLDSVGSSGYIFQVDMAWKLAQEGARIVEVPITFVERRLGTSKMSGNVIQEALRKVTVWGLRARIEKIKNFVNSKAKGSASRNAQR